MQTWRGAAGSVADVVWFGTLAAMIIATRTPETPENRNDAQRAPSARPGLSMPFRECAQSPWVLILKSGGLSVELTKATV